MKWSQYDLDLRAWCIANGKPIPGKPETYYEVRWQTPVFNGIAYSGVRDYTVWGKNTQVTIRLNDYNTAEEYWEAVRINAAKNLDANCVEHRGQRSQA